MSSNPDTVPAAARRHTTSESKPPAISTARFAPSTPTGEQLERERLLERMSNAGARLILACATAGYGKTALLRQYRERCAKAGQETLWCTLETGDDDLCSFVTLLRTGLATLASSSGEKAPIDTDERQSAQGLLEQIAHHESPFVLLLDDFDRIRKPATLEFVQHLVRALPAHGTLAIAARSTPELDLGRLRASGQLLEINTDALRLSSEESARYVRELRQLSMPDDKLSVLHSITEGWITALYLATLSLQWRTDPGAFVESFTGTSQELAEYLSEDILAQQDEEVRRFLLQTSVLGTFSAALCDVVTGREDSRRVIEQLERANLFISPVDERRQWFRYHQLFESFLQDTLERQLPGMARELHQDAAQWHLAHNRPVQVIEHLLAADDIENAARELDARCDQLMLSGRSGLLLRWLDRIPTEVQSRYPRRGVGYAWALVLDRRHRDALRVIERPEIADAAESIHCLLLLVTDQPAEAATACAAQLAVLPEKSAMHAFVCYCLIGGLFSTGHFDEARRMLSLPSMRETQRQSVYLHNHADGIEALLDLVQGQLDNALARLRTAMERPRKVPVGSPRTGHPVVDISISLTQYEAGDLESASARLRDALPFVKDHGTPDILITTYVLLARIAYLEGDRDRWMRYLADLDQFGYIVDSDRVQCAAWLERARVGVLEDRLDTAAHAQRSAEQLASWDHPGVLMYSTDTDTPFIGRTRLRIALGETAVAADLRPALDEAVSRHQLRRALKLRLLLAMALDAQKQPKEAFVELGRALAFASRTGFVRIFLDEGPRMTALLERWSVVNHGREAESGVNAHFVARLLQRNQPPARTQQTTEEGETCAGLSVRELQVMRLLAMGYRNREIAEKMYISELTVKSHLRKINSKLGTQGRTQAISKARGLGLID